MRRFHDSAPTLVFWSVAVFLSVCQLGASELWGPEDRWAEVVREMHLTGDYFHPTINGKPYFDKPLLSYWLIALVSAVTGHLNEWTVRFPSILAGFLALAATMNLGRRLWSQEQARTAGWILLSTFGFLFWTRTGEADMENLAAVILAVAWYWARRDKPGFLSYFVFYLICFVGAQAKGMAAIAVPLVAVFPDVVRNGRWKSYLSLTHLLALALGLSVYLAPMVYAESTRAGYQASGLGMAFRENITRYFRPFDHKEHFYVYFFYLPQLFFPWVPLLIAAIWATATWFRRLEWPTKWLGISVMLIFLFFTLSGSRRSYYILPIFPFCSLLASLYWEAERQNKPRALTLKIQKALLAVVVALELLSPLAWPVVARQIGFIAPPELVWGTILLGLLAAMPLVLERLRPGLLGRITGTERVWAPLLVTAVILVGGYFVWQRQITDRYRTTRSFCTELRSQIGDTDAQIRYFGKLDRDILFYLKPEEPIHGIKDEQELRDFLSCPTNTRVLIVHNNTHENLARAFPKGMAPEPTLKERIYPWEKESKKKLEAWIVRRGVE